MYGRGSRAVAFRGVQSGVPIHASRDISLLRYHKSTSLRDQDIGKPEPATTSHCLCYRNPKAAVWV